MSKISHPIISEKATALSERSIYAFQVDPGANKFEIKKAVEDLYRVNVTRVNMVRIHPKKRTYRGRAGFKAGYKKALVFLKAGQKIDLA